jgi:hypothetical protein
MKRLVFGLVVLCFALSARQALALSQYHYTWICDDTDCSFSANAVANVSGYEWKFGDGTYGSGQNVNHTYNPPSPGHGTPRVTLTYHFTNGTVRNVRCYITYYERGGIGGDPTPNLYEGTCEGFN